MVATGGDAVFGVASGHNLCVRPRCVAMAGDGHYGHCGLPGMWISARDVWRWRAMGHHGYRGSLYGLENYSDS